MKKSTTFVVEEHFMESSKKELIAKLDTLHSSKFLCSALLKLHSDEVVLRDYICNFIPITDTENHLHQGYKQKMKLQAETVGKPFAEGSSSLLFGASSSLVFVVPNP
ncbi:hypothetical protein GYH30_018706 [Glycine max]|nr:hypothetical protein GYH30_018706 [Glycine max]